MEEMYTVKLTLIDKCIEVLKIFIGIVFHKQNCSISIFGLT